MTTVQNPYCHDDVPFVDYDARFSYARQVLGESDAERVAMVAALSESARDRSYSTVEVAALMGLSPVAVYFRMRRGTLPFAKFRIRREWRFAKHDVHAWIIEQDGESAA